MAPAFDRTDNERRRPLGSHSNTHRQRLDMEENRRPARDPGAEHLNIPHSDDYQYDEAHDDVRPGRRVRLLRDIVSIRQR